MTSPSPPDEVNTVAISAADWRAFAKASLPAAIASLTTVGVRLRRLVFQTLLRQDIQFFDRRDTGEITTRLWADVPPLEYVLGEEFADTLRAAVFSLCGTGLLFYTSPRLTLLMLLAVPPIALATSLLGRRVKMLAADVQKVPCGPAPLTPVPARSPPARAPA